jgi:hypothetical protein
MDPGDSAANRLRSVLRTSGLRTAETAVRSLLEGVFASRRSPRGPYVQGVTATSAIICWVSRPSGVGAVRYGKAPDLGREGTDRRIGRRHAVALAGLDPGSTYLYRVEDADGSSQTGAFSTAPVGECPRFSFAVVGDSGSGGKGQLGWELTWADRLAVALEERGRPTAPGCSRT